MLERIPPRSGTAFRLDQGQVLEVTDLEGCQVADLIAFAADDVREALSNGRTFDYEETLKLTTGNTLWSNRSNPMLTLVHDDVGCHDFLLTPCSEATFRHFYPEHPVHRGCFGNLAEALAPYGVEPDRIGTAFNLFMNVPFDGASGRIRVEPPPSRAGDCLRLEARMDLVIGLTACSAYASNGGSFKPIGWRILS
ncbi:urea carboxylase-associated family protein [Alteraurantiacibacter palmitatis]|uniref:Urea carboxylase-associated family protein n=1 Tax=Alteraurantiacibacter palmitatis TaxID=2054628 RepID=A0ABV7E7R5_9SPHN